MTLTQIKPAGLSKPVDLADNEQIRLGTGNDLLIFHDGTNSSVQNGTGTLRLRGDSIKLNNNAASENYLVASVNGAVELYYDNVKKFETQSYGVSAVGQIYVTHNGTTPGFSLSDNGRSGWGSGNDLVIYHNGTNSIINHTLGSGALRVQANDVRLMNNAGNEHFFVGFANDYAGLYFDNSQKLKTTSTGVNVTGKLGIGTTSPGYDVTVYNSSGTSRGRFHTAGTTGNDYSDVAVQAGNNYAQMFVYGTGQVYMTASAPATMSVGNVADSSLYLTTNNTIRQTITNDGKVGIGTSNPDFEFQVEDSSGAAVIRAKDGANNKVVDLIANSTGGLVRTVGAYPLVLSTNQVERMRIDSSGRVLIATDAATGASTNADDLKIGNTDSGSQRGLTIGSAIAGNIRFADASDDTAGAIVYNHSNDRLAFYAASGLRASIDSNGLKFGSDTAAANALDDYEEGTWTPQMHDGGGSNVVLSLSSGDNFYTKIGRVVFINGIITRNETGSKSGDLMLTGLPFAGNSVSQLATGVWWMDRGFGNDTVGGVCYKLGSGTTSMRFVNPTAVNTNAGGDDAAKSATRYLQFGQWQQSKHIYFNLTYMTA